MKKINGDQLNAVYQVSFNASFPNSKQDKHFIRFFIFPKSYSEEKIKDTLSLKLPGTISEVMVVFLHDVHISKIPNIDWSELYAH